MYKAIFTWVSKVIRVCLHFALLRLGIGLKNSRHYLDQSEVKAKPILTYTRFPALRAGYNVFVTCFDCLTGLSARVLQWLARVIARFWFYTLDLRQEKLGETENRLSRS